MAKELPEWLLYEDNEHDFNYTTVLNITCYIAVITVNENATIAHPISHPPHKHWLEPLSYA